MKQISTEKIDKILKSLAKDAEPDEKFMLSLEHKLEARFKEVHKSKSEHSTFFNHFRFKLQFASVLSLMVLTSTTIFAYSSDGVAEGHLLYPIKRGTEKIEEFFATTPEDKYAHQEKMRQRRVRELIYIKEHEVNPERVKIVTEEISKTVEKQTEEFKRLSTDQQERIRENFKENQRKLEEKIRKKNQIFKSDPQIQKIEESINETLNENPITRDIKVGEIILEKSGTRPTETSTEDRAKEIIETPTLPNNQKNERIQEETRVLFDDVSKNGFRRNLENLFILTTETEIQIPTPIETPQTTRDNSTQPSQTTPIDTSDRTVKEIIIETEETKETGEFIQSEDFSTENLQNNLLESLNLSR